MKRGALALGGLVLAVASLAAPAAPTFDAWVWMGWGNQLRDGGLDASGPTAWKPFGAAAGLLLSPLGDAAPTAWLLLVRVAALVTLAAIALVAGRLSTSPPLAAGLGVLVAASLRNVLPAVLQGASEVVLAALLATAGALALPTPAGARRPGREVAATALVLVAGTIRPEVWPIAVAAAAAVSWRRGVAAGAAATASVLAMLGAWAVPVGSSPAVQAKASPLAATTGPGTVLLDALTSAPVGAVALAVAAVALALRDRGAPCAPGRVAVLAPAAAAATIAVAAAVEGALGYPAPARFVLPVGVLVALVAGAGVDAVASRTPRAVAVALVVLVGVEALARVGHAADAHRDRVVPAADRADDVAAAIEAAGRDRVRSAAQVCVSDPQTRAQVAFLLRVPVGTICSDGFAGRRADPTRPRTTVHCAGTGGTGTCAVRDVPPAAD